MQGKLFIDGVWQDAASGATFATVDPATEEIIQEVAWGRRAEVDGAVQAAERAMRGPWREIAPAERGQLLLRLAERIGAARHELAALETADMGKPLGQARSDVDGVVATVIYNAGAADKMEGTTIPLGHDVVDFTLLEPLGVTAHIVPWNYPLGMAMRSLAPALAAGCTAVLKPAEQSPLSALRLAELVMEAGFPKGVVNVVTGLGGDGSGEEAGEALVRHPAVRGISFTGSLETGRRIMAAAAEHVTPVVLELGGKNPMLVFEDADLDRAVDDAIEAGFDNAGQVCSSASRLLLQQPIEEAFLERFEARAKALRIGPGRDDPDLGPIAFAEQYAKVTGYVDLGRDEGARLRLGGRRPGHLNRGHFLEPTLFDRVGPAMRIAREEIFGPVVTAMTFDRDAEAIEIANGLGQGLCAGAHTRDLGRALRLTRQLEAGSVWINGWFMGGVQAPTGGVKQSGIGRERGLPGVRNYLQIKNVSMRL